MGARSSRSEGAPHTTDVPFVLHAERTRYGEQTFGQDTSVGTIISRFVIAFAHSGGPNTAGLPSWPRDDRGGNQIVDFAGSGIAVAQRDPWR